MGYELTSFVGEVDQEFICTICMMVLELPVESPCEHTFCSACIEEWIAVEPKCPVDRQPLHSSDLRKMPRYFLNLLDKLEVRCKLESFGCQATIPMERQQSHYTSCIYKPDGIVVCDKGCNITMTRREYQENCYTHLEKRVCGQLEKMKKTIEDLRREQDNSESLFSRQQEEIKKLNDEVSNQQQVMVKLINKSILPPKCFWKIRHNIKVLPDQPNILEPIPKLFPWSFAQLSYALEPEYSFFRFQILSIAANEYITIGLTKNGHEIHDMPGYNVGTISYYDKGQLVINGKTEFGLQAFQTGDIIECGIKFPDNFSTADFRIVQVYFSVNFRIISKKTMKMPDDGFFPSIRMGSFTTATVPKVEYLYI